MTRREKTAVRRRQIVDATLALLADVPVGELTTRRIAKALGLSQPALFRHFMSRDALLLAAIDVARGELGGLVEGALAAGSTASERLEALAAALLAFTEAHPGLPRLLFGDAAAAGAGPEVQAALRQLLAMQRQLVTALARDGQRAGELRADLAPERAATLFVGMIQGLVLQWQLGHRAAPLASEAAPLVRLWLHGAARRTTAPADAPTPAAARAPAPHPTLRVLDVRPVLAAGDDPLDLVLAAVDAAGPGGAVAITAPFRPNPLIALLGGRGHRVEARESLPGVWSVDVALAGAPPLEDLRDLPAPEPLERVLEATAALAPGATYLARLPRFPRLLLPHLDARGLTHAVSEQPDGAALLFVTRPR